MSAYDDMPPRVNSYFFFFGLHMVVGHMPLRTLQGEKSAIILRS